MLSNVSLTLYTHIKHFKAIISTFKPSTLWIPITIRHEGQQLANLANEETMPRKRRGGTLWSAELEKKTIERETKTDGQPQ